MSDVKSRPGVMIYFEAVRPALSRLDNEQCGALFRAIIDYAEYGAVADLDSMAGMVFDLLRPKIDRDAEKYEESREQRQHAVYVREAKRRGEQPLTLSEWRLLHRELPSDNGSISAGNEINEPYPSTTTSISPSIIPSPSITPSGTGEGTGEGYKGEGGPQQLYRDWLAAMDDKDGKKACELSNRLFALGYDVDIRTRELNRRAN